MLLVAQIYTGGKALQFLSVPVFTIFKNLTIIVIAYGEVLLSGGRVTPLVLLSFGLMVFSSVIAAWADVNAAAGSGSHPDKTDAALRTLNTGYAWMLANVFCAAAYVLGKGRVMKKLQTRDWDGKKLLLALGISGWLCVMLTVQCSHILQQPAEHSCLGSRFFPHRRLVCGQLCS